MYKKKSTKGIKRGPYRRAKSDFDKLVADVFGNRINELGITQTQLLEDNMGKVTAPTLSRILKGAGGTSINTMAVVADMLGLEIVFKPKQTDNEDKD